MRLVNLILLMFLICTSCGDKEELQEELQKEVNCLTAVINGKDFTAETTTGTFIIINIEYEALGNQETKLLTINGIIPSLTSDLEIVTLVFACSEFTSELDYIASDSDCGIDMKYQVTSFLNPTGSLVIAGTEGGINVEEITDERIRGTFTFKGEDQNGMTYDITDGFFDTTIE